INDASTTSIEPAGVAPDGSGGGPFVGPYQAAAAITAAVTFPVNATTYTTASFNAGNSTPAGDIAGTVNYNNNSTGRTIAVSIKRTSDNTYWNGSTFTGTTENFNPATTCTSCTGNGSGTWAYNFAAPAEGSYIVHARATDSGGTV